MTRLAYYGTFTVYDLATGTPHMTVKNAVNPNDPAWLLLNNDLTGLRFARLDIHPDIYNQLDYWGLDAYHKKYIPIHRAKVLAERLQGQYLVVTQKRKNR